MAELHMTAGAVADVASGAEVAESADKLFDRIVRHDRHKRPGPGSWIRLANSAVAAAGVPTILLFDSPPVGHLLEVRQVIVTGGDDRTNLPGTSAAFYVGDDPAPGMSPSLADLVLPATLGGTTPPLPNTADFGQHDCVVYPAERAFLIVYGAAAGQNLLGIIRCWLRPLEPNIDRGT